jgi:NDP-sugar pyrophosphorylase family protein
MVPVLGRPLIDRTLDRLGEIGVGEAVVNLHYRPDMLRAHVSGRKAPSAPYVFTGAQILSPSLFDDVPEGPFSLNLVWDRAIAAGRAFGIVHPGAWCDVGTPEGLAEAEEALG